MARGWESKSIEMQIEEASGTSEQASGITAPAAELEWRRIHEDLLLRRSRILQDLSSARNPRYRNLLEETLKHVENELGRAPNPSS